MGDRVQDEILNGQRVICPESVEYGDGQCEVCPASVDTIHGAAEEPIDEKQKKTLDLILLSQHGDEAARDALVKENLGLVWSIVHRFANRGYEAEDLFQIGSIGLIKAIQRFDTSFQVRFSTYAVPMISGEIRRFIRDDGVIKISRSVKENYWKIQQAIQKLQKQTGQDVTISQIAEATGLSADEIVLALDAPVEVDSLNKPVGIGEGKEARLEDRITVKMDENEQVDNRVVLEQLLSNLNAKERQLIYLRYFQDCTQTVVAQKLQMSQVQVSRLEKKLLRTMREQMGDL